MIKYQIDKLLESKDNMQVYYLEEVKNLKQKIELLTSENNEMKAISQNIQKEINIQKNKTDLYNQ